MLVKFNPASQAAKALASIKKLPRPPIKCGTKPPKLPNLPIKLPKPLPLPCPRPLPRPIDDFCGTGPRPPFPFPPKLNDKIASFAKAFV